MKNIDITDSMIADYTAAWNHADAAQDREPGDRRRAGLTAVAPAIAEIVLRRLMDKGGLCFECSKQDVRDFAMEEFGIEL
jgi:hypothetical protein